MNCISYLLGALSIIGGIFLLIKTRKKEVLYEDHEIEKLSEETDRLLNEKNRVLQSEERERR